MVLALALFSAYKPSGPNQTAEKNVKPAAAKDLKNINKQEVSDPKKETGSINQQLATEGKPRILFMLTNETGMKKWSPSLWWSYNHAKPGQPGC